MAGYPPPNTELLERCAAVLEACAMEMSTKSPDRRIPIYARDVAERALELLDAIELHPSRILDAAARMVNSCDRLAPHCPSSIYPCCRDCGALCREVSSSCRAFLDEAFGQLPKAA